MTRKLYTADLHLDHMMILKHAFRPFKNIAEQQAMLIRNFNQVLEKGDILYVLGDTGISKNSHVVIYDFLKELNATEFHLIVGNHDSKKVQRLDIWTTVTDIKEVKDDGQRFVLCHYPLAQWNGAAHGSIHLHGHSHGNFVHRRRAVDVGVDCWNFRPVMQADILHKLKIKDYLNAEEESHND